MIWQSHQDMQSLIHNDIVIGSVFPWAGAWAAALDGETMKTARSAEQGRAFINKHADTHLKKLCLMRHEENGAEYVLELKELNRVDDKANKARAAEIRARKFEQLEF